MWLDGQGDLRSLTSCNALPFLRSVRGAELCKQELLRPCRATNCCLCSPPSHGDQRRAGGRWTVNVTRRMEQMAVRATDPQTICTKWGKGTDG